MGRCRRREPGNRGLPRFVAGPAQHKSERAGTKGAAPDHRHGRLPRPNVNMERLDMQRRRRTPNGIRTRAAALKGRGSQFSDLRLLDETAVQGRCNRSDSARCWPLSALRDGTMMARPSASVPVTCVAAYSSADGDQAIAGNRGQGVVRAHPEDGSDDPPGFRARSRGGHAPAPGQWSMRQSHA